MLTGLVLFIVCFVLCLLSTWTVRRLAFTHGWIRPPKSSRHLHSRPIPRLGGVAIFFALVVGVLAIALFSAVSGQQFPVSVKRLLGITSPALLIFALGLWDDIRDLSPWIKLAVQSLAAVLLFVSGFRISNIFGMHPLGWIAALAATIIWVVWITNAFNLIDGMDGLAAGSALFSTLVVLLNAVISHDALTLFLTAGLAGCILGFLRFNFNPATIFLGDSGSLLIGFLLASMALVQAQKSPTLVAVALPVLALGLPIVDTTLAVARRFLSGRPLFAADREHIHHKLLDKGLSQRRVVLLLYAVSAVFGLLALFLRYPGGNVIGVIVVVVGLCLVVGVQQLGYVEFFELRRVAERTMAQREIIINDLALRRCRQELARCSSFQQICAALCRAFQNNDFEGFELLVLSGSGMLQKEKAAPLALTDEGLFYAWAKNDEPSDRDCCWDLCLRLQSSQGDLVGSLVVYRSYGDRALMFDVNLLTAGFATTLADALVRALTAARAKAPTRAGASVLA